MVTEPTREDHILDLMLTNNPSIIKSVHILPGFSDHEVVLSDSNLAPSYARKLPRKIHLFSKANWAEVRQKISDFSATYFNTMSELDINTKWNTLKKQLNDIMDSCIPTKMTTTRHNVPWINRTLIRLTRNKQRLFNKAKKKKGNEAWSWYKSYKKQVDSRWGKPDQTMWTTSSSQPSKKRTPNLFGNSSAPSEEKTLELHCWSPRGNCLLMADLKQKSWTTNSNPNLLRRSPLTYLHHMDPTQQHDVSVQSTLDRRPMYYSQKQKWTRRVRMQTQ